MTALLRPMISSDLPAVLVLEQELFGEEAWSRQMLASELAELPSRYYLVAEDSGAVAGYAGLFAPDRGQADVLTLAVTQRRWGAGIGSLLLDALLAEAARRGCPEVFLEVRVDNDRAQRLYLRRGFTRIGLRRGYYQPSGTDAVVMRLELGMGPAGPGRTPGAAAQAGGRS
jgi:ribosomal-protein-alanine N-acetyltransferase